jgi:hypothetical protein
MIAPAHKAAMSRERSPSGLRAIALAVALFAITLNFLQPLVHAAALRDGSPQALWSVFCKPAVQHDDTQAPTVADKHECCLGLTHAPALIAPSSTFILVEPVVIAAAASLPADRATPVVIRDSPTRPRGPPVSFA